VRLPDHLGEIARTVFAGQNNIRRHAGILRGCELPPDHSTDRIIAYNMRRRAFPHGEAANRVRWGTKQP
jgi:hypothetical protein